MRATQVRRLVNHSLAESATSGDRDRMVERVISTLYTHLTAAQRQKLREDLETWEVVYGQAHKEGVR